MKFDATNPSISIGLAAQRYRLLSEQGTHSQADDFEAASLDFYSEDSGLARFIATYKPTCEEFVILMLVLTPHIKPGFFANIIAEHLPEGGDFSEFGGVKVANHRGIVPTGVLGLTGVLQV